MKQSNNFLYSFITFYLLIFCCSCMQGNPTDENGRILYVSDIRVGADQMDEYLPLISSKRIAIVANQTSLIKNVHIVDTLHRLNVKIGCVFAPEHGFRGEAGAGEKIESGKDSSTGIPVVSLYGNRLKPLAKDLADVDVVIFDIQDVGARFYTYISTLQYVMESCAENDKMMIVLDRPNPNGFYVDGPTLEAEYKSFVGMTRIPVVHGMTTGEYAKMLKGEKWFANADALNLQVIPVLNYNHRDFYQLPVRPSPNLPNMQSVYLYPSLCLFEGTSVSLGRGTDLPFQCYGFPQYPESTFSFKPRSIPGVVKDPPYKGFMCYGVDLSKAEILQDPYAYTFQLRWLIDAYEKFPEKQKFFNSFFEKLSGTKNLREQIEKGIPETEIRKSWEEDILSFKEIRKNYLLYPDFE